MVGRSSNQHRIAVKPASRRRRWVSSGPAKTKGDRPTSSGALAAGNRFDDLPDAIDVALTTALDLQYTRPQRPRRPSPQTIVIGDQCSVAVETIASTGSSTVRVSSRPRAKLSAAWRPGRVRSAERRGTDVRTGRFCERVRAPGGRCRACAYSRVHQERNAWHDRCCNHTPREQVRPDRRRRRRNHHGSGSERRPRILALSSLRVAEPHRRARACNRRAGARVLGAAKRTRGSPGRKAPRLNLDPPFGTGMTA